MGRTEQRRVRPGARCDDLGVRRAPVPGSATTAPSPRAQYGGCSMRQPLLDAVRALDPAADGREIDGEAMLARIREEVHSAAQADVTHLLPPRRSRPAQRLAMGAAPLTGALTSASP